MFASINGILIPVDNARLHISDLSIQRGYGIFDFLKVDNGHPFFLEDYLNRFFNSASIMRLPVPLLRSELKETIYALIDKNLMLESGIKMILTGGYSQDGYQIGEPNLIVTQHPLVLPSKDVLKAGVKIITHEYVRDFPEVKTINYTMGIWLIDLVQSRNAYDVLYVKDGLVSEFPRSNFFIVTHDNTVVTAAKNVLQGVTRKNIVALAQRLYKLEERDLTLNEVYKAKEAFITSTTKRIVPVTQINDSSVGKGKPGEVSLILLEKLIALENSDRLANART